MRTEFTQSSKPLVLIVQPWHQGMHGWPELQKLLRQRGCWADTWVTPYCNLAIEFHRLLAAIDRFRKLQDAQEYPLVVARLPWWCTVAWQARWTPEAQRILESGLKARGVPLLTLPVRRANTPTFRLECTSLDMAHIAIQEALMQQAPCLDGKRRYEQ